MLYSFKIKLTYLSLPQKYCALWVKKSHRQLSLAKKRFRYYPGQTGITYFIIFLLPITILSCSNKVYKREYIFSFPVIIDSGHGGDDPGAVYKNVCEDEINYDISLRTYLLLKKKGIKVHLTVKDLIQKNPRKKLLCDKNEVLRNNEKISLKGRKKIIESFSKNNDGILISIHVNSLLPIIKGAASYYPSEKYKNKHLTAVSSHLAKIIDISFRKNKITPMSIGSKKITIPLFSTVRKGFMRGSSFKLAIFKGRGPSARVVIECGNIKNDYDRKKLSDPIYRQKISVAIVEAIENIYKTKLPIGFLSLE